MNPVHHIETSKEHVSQFRGERSYKVPWTPKFFSIQSLIRTFKRKISKVTHHTPNATPSTSVKH